jgi:hypothetical protein
MPQNNYSKNIKEKNLEEITNELFQLIRTCYNQGDNDIKLQILDNSMKIILDSLQRESDLTELKNVFDNIIG